MSPFSPTDLLQPPPPTYIFNSSQQTPFWVPIYTLYFSSVQFGMTPIRSMFTTTIPSTSVIYTVSLLWALTTLCLAWLVVTFLV